MSEKTPIKEIPFEVFARGHRLSSKRMVDTFYPAVSKKESPSGKINYNICILTGESWRGPYTTLSWDYFNLDESGLILNSPRGMAKQYNKKVRLLGMEQAVEDYKDKVV